MIEAYDVAFVLEEKIKTLKIEATALRTAGASPEEIAETVAILKDAEAARDLLVLGASARRELAEKAKRHAEILPQCVAARELLDELKPKVQPANDAVITADKSYQNAKDNAAWHEANPLPRDSYPSAKAIRQWNIEGHTLESVVEQRRLDLLAKKADANKLRQDLLKAIAEFDRLSLAERTLRPPQAAARPIPVAWRLQEQPELTGIGPNR